MFGRKLPMILTSLTSLIGFIIFYFSRNLLHLFIYSGFIGLSSASQITTSIFILTEYTSPRYRGIFLTIKSASMFWGIWTANFIGTFFHWRNISILGILCSVYALLTTFLWPESPYWLAKKQRYAECTKSQRWLKGSNEDSERELDKLLNTKISGKKFNLVQFYKSFMSNKLYKYVFITSIVMLLYNFSGKLVCSIYAIDIIKNMTSSESTAYTGMLILDGVTVISMYVGCVISKFVKRRTQLIVSSSIAVVALFALSLYLYLIKKMIISDNKIISLALLVIFSMSICVGPIIMSTSIFGELLPLKYRNFCVCFMSLLCNLFLATSLKFGPIVFKTFGLHGAFLFYGLCSFFFLILTYVYLPETKDKTLQEIQDGLRGYTEDRRADEINSLISGKRGTV